MPRADDSSRFSSMTGSSTDSARSSITVKPLPLTPTTPSLPTAPCPGNNGSRFAPHGSRRAAPSRLKTDDNGSFVR
ncbi:uncharacterized protein THITE_2121046 [Thermothielavioides terrestris NRRL 8126]|uniref:Uncharacterized protein n=2 Tax=Thermothielavioides terrestris TaxID=2587410 RepID=G2REC5_THETT|nr:uncharacterized protein THITE_2121046 [Thermothielavioides terrestris NRRL 8126]AEO70097.1 hypothetical protein THITE_2121046 [Thermothielavioides terrestris NRRL 8126]